MLAMTVAAFQADVFHNRTVCKGRTATDASTQGKDLCMPEHENRTEQQSLNVKAMFVSIMLHKK